MHRLLFCALSTMLLLGSAAQAAPIATINGETKIYLSSLGTLSDLGVGVNPMGTGLILTGGDLPSPFVLYNVTAVDPATQEILHAGSVLELSRGNTVTLSDFIIDVAQGLVFADVASPSLTGPAAVFEIKRTCTFADPCVGLDGTSTIAGLELLLTQGAADVLAADLGLDDLTGAPIGVSNTIYTLIPEPTTAFLTMSGLFILGHLGRRRS